MSSLMNVAIVVHVLVAMAIVGLVLLQHGKGADMGAAFGSGSSGSVFGSAGSANFLSRTTAVLATVFFLTSITLTWFGSQTGVPQGVMEKGVMERVLPAKPSDVPQPANGAATARPSAPAGAVPGEAPKSNEVPK